MADQRADTWRPSPELELLVRAATDDGERARAAWLAWKDRVGMTKLDGASLRLLPLLYRNLQRNQIETSEVKELANNYRRVWAKNQIALRHTEEVVNEFERRGIKTLVLKGAALLLRYYEDNGVRPMSDFDILVPVEQTDAAVATLIEAGWRGSKPLHLLTEEYRAPIHGLGFQHDDKAMGCDLHWHIMHLHLAAAYDAPMWEASVPLQLGKTPTLALCSAHQLIHIFLNGCMNEAGTNLRWLTDAIVVLKRDPSMEWERLVTHCQLLEFTQPVANMLDYLRTEWELPVPVQVIETLAHTPVSYRMRKALETFNIPKPERSNVQVFWLLYTQYALSQPPGSRSFPFGFIQFLRQRWTTGGIGRTLNYALLRARGVTARQAKQTVKPTTSG